MQVAKSIFAYYCKYTCTLDGSQPFLIVQNKGFCNCIEIKGISSTSGMMHAWVVNKVTPISLP
jgi:hypothetical protein